MSDPVDALILDLLEWVAAAPRSYAETIDAWRTSCPRLPVWEETRDRRWLRRFRDERGDVRVVVTEAGQAVLAAQRQAAPTVPHRAPRPPA